MTKSSICPIRRAEPGLGSLRHSSLLARLSPAAPAAPGPRSNRGREGHGSCQRHGSWHLPTGRRSRPGLPGNCPRFRDCGFRTSRSSAYSVVGSPERRPSGIASQRKSDYFSIFFNDL
nr:MAG TPA: hypothetical protein [Caudoviricetes sp.]